MRFQILSALIVFATMAGCIDDLEGEDADVYPSSMREECGVPADADMSREPYYHGVVLFTVRYATTVDAWACNESESDRWLLGRDGDCLGSWTWSYEPPNSSHATVWWPDETNYGACESWQRISYGQAELQTLELDIPHKPGGEWRIRLQIYTQPAILIGGGGGPVHAVYVL